MEDSLKKRYLYKLGASIIGVPINLVTQAIVPRALGPGAYGNFSFLTNFFSRIISFFDSGTSSAFYTKLSQRQQDSGLVRFYWGYAGIACSLVVLFVFGAMVLNVYRILWPGQQMKYVWMGLTWGMLQWMTQIINNVVDAHALTVSGEIKRLQQKILGLSLILTLFLVNMLSLTLLFMYYYVTFIFLCIIWAQELKKHGIHIVPVAKLGLLNVKRYVREFYSYANPLVVYSFFGLLTGIADRWMLQKFAGSVQQGFYGLSYQIGSISFLFASAMTPLLLREFSTAFAKQDFEEMRRLFQRYVPMLYSIVALISVFVAVQSKNVVFIMGGKKYEQASVALSIMAVYPIHQTYGQLSNSIYLATGRTRLYRNLGTIIIMLGLAVNFFLVAPKSLFGMGLGATGLAIKMVTMQFFEVNLMLWFNVRFLRLSFWTLIWHQIYVLALLFCLALSISDLIERLASNILVEFLIAGVLYAIGCVALMFVLPSMFSLSRTEFRGMLPDIAKRITEWW